MELCETVFIVGMYLESEKCRTVGVSVILVAIKGLERGEYYLFRVHQQSTGGLGSCFKWYMLRCSEMKVWKTITSSKYLAKNQKLLLPHLVTCTASGARKSLVSSLHYNFTCFLSQAYAPYS